MNKRNQQKLVNILKNTGLNPKFQRFAKALSANQVRTYLDTVEDCFVLSRIAQNLDGNDIEKYKESQKQWLGFLVDNEYEPFKPYISKHGKEKLKSAITWLIENYKWESPIWNESIGRISVYTYERLKCIDDAVVEVEKNPVTTEEIVECETIEQEETEQNEELIDVDKARVAYDSLENAMANIKEQMAVLGDFLLQDFEQDSKTIKEKNEHIKRLEKEKSDLSTEIEEYKSRVNELEEEVLRYVSELDKERNKPNPVRIIPYSDLTSLPLIGEKAASVLMPFFERRVNVKFDMNR